VERDGWAGGQRRSQGLDGTRTVLDGTEGGGDMCGSPHMRLAHQNTVLSLPAGPEGFVGHEPHTLRTRPHVVLRFDRTLNIIGSDPYACHWCGITGRHRRELKGNGCA